MRRNSEKAYYRISQKSIRRNQQQSCSVIGLTTLKEWKRSRKEANESLAPRKRQSKPKKLPPDELRAYVKANPDAYLSEIAQHFNYTKSPVERALKKHGITRKKTIKYQERDEAKRAEL